MNIARQVNLLFRVFLSPDGDEYTLQEVSEATGGRISPGYLSLLRSGKRNNPSAQVVHALAEFFQVPAGFLFGEGLPEPEGDQTGQLEEALEDPLIKKIALRSHGLNSETKKLVLLILEREKRLAEMQARSAGD